MATSAWSGPASATVGTPVILMLSTSGLSGAATFAPGDGGAGGRFNPPALAATAARTECPVLYTPAASGAISISASVTSGSVSAPSPFALTVAGAAAAEYTLTAPNPMYGAPGVASENFAVSLGFGTSSGLVVTPSDSGGGGTFTPASVTLSTGSPSATFTYTNASAGWYAISTSNGGGLPDPPSADYLAGAVVSIDSAWLSANGPAPYSLPATQTAYVLATDITATGSAIGFGANQVVLDLAGHNVLYDTAAPISVANGNFESGDLSSWDVSLAPSAAAAAQRLMWGEWMCKFSGISSAESITSASISIPTANAPYAASFSWWTSGDGSVTLDVIDVTTSTVLATSTNSASGSGLVVQFTPTTTDPVKIKITCTPNTVKPTDYQVDYVQLLRANVYGVNASFHTDVAVVSSVAAASGATAGAATISGGAITAVAAGAGGSGYTAATIAVVNNAAGLSSAGILAAVTPTVAAGAVTGYTVASGGSGYAGAEVDPLCGNLIAQGQARSYASYPINAFGTTRLTLVNVQPVAYGEDTVVLYGNFIDGVTILGCTMTGALDQISNRQAALGFVYALASGGQIHIEGNVLQGGHQNGIAISGPYSPTDPYPLIWIRGNTIRQNSHWTDGYGLGIGGNFRNALYADNTVIPSSGRGIICDSGAADNTIAIHDVTFRGNYLEVQENPDLEFGQGGLEATGVRLRSEQGQLRDILFDGNILYGHTGVGQDWACAGTRLTVYNDFGQNNNTGVLFVNNLFMAVVETFDSGVVAQAAWGLTLSRVDAGTGITFKDNRMRSNNYSLHFGDNDGINEAELIFLGNTVEFSASGIGTLPLAGIVVGDWGSHVTDVDLIDMQYGSGVTPGATFLSTAGSDISFGFSANTTVLSSGSPVPGATVVSRSGGTQLWPMLDLASQPIATLPIAADSSGLLQVLVPVTRYSSDGTSGQNASPVSTSYLPVTLAASASGGRSGSGNIASMSGDQSITIALSAGAAGVLSGVLSFSSGAAHFLPS